MYRFITALFCMIFLSGINGAWLTLPTSVDEDAITLTRLAEEFWSLKPAVFQNKGPLVLCQVIDECCATDDRAKAVSLMVSSITDENRSRNRYARILNTCINSTDQSCPPLFNLISPSITLQEKSDIKQHRRIIMNYDTKLNDLINRVNESCNNEEIHALLCLSDTKLVKTCINKILRSIYDVDGYKVYHEYVVETKQTLIDVNQQLSELFIKNTNTI
jgi:hypothetical protein